MRVFWVVLLFSSTLNGFGQVLEPIPLSRQDSALIEKNQSQASQLMADGNQREASDLFNQSAMLYWEHNHFNEAVGYFEESYEINRLLGNENGMAMINSNLALLFAEMNEYEKALESFFSTYSIRKAKGEKIGTISALINMSVVTNNLGQYDRSVKNLKEALDIARGMSDINQMKSCYGMLCETYEKAGNTDSALYYFSYYESFHEKMQEEKVEKVVMDMETERLRAELAEAREREKEYELLKNRLELQKKEDALKESGLERDQLVMDLTKNELQMTLIKQNAEIEELKSKNELERRGKIVISTSFGFVVLLLLLVWLTLAFRQKRRVFHKLNQQHDELQLRNEEIVEQHNQITQQRDEITYQKNDIELIHKELTSSITYAQNIQNAILPNEQKIGSLLNEYFIFFRPRDVVSGDFYWVATPGEQVIVGVADCTGHGVPGALMSMLSISLLNGIVNKEGVTNTGEILDRLRQGIITSLKSHDDQSKMRDGLDIALCRLDLKSRKIEFSGANNPLYIVRNNDLEPIPNSRVIEKNGKVLYEIKGDRAFVGACPDMQAFSSHEIEVMPGDTLYMYSDGYIDQMGGPKEKKFKSSALKQLILDSCHQPMKQQQQIFTEAFNNWKGDTFQIDDVLLMGIKL
ncbi:MAG: SpoIIE family protein phosphatase [Bacteroidota bacterium]